MRLAFLSLTRMSLPPPAAPASILPLVPPVLAAWLSVFRPCFTAPVWNRVLVLVAGAVLAPGRRTVTQTLRVMGLAGARDFRRYHEVLSKARWDARDVARRLPLHMVARLAPEGDVVIGVDDSIERRWGPRISARGIYRDPVRSSKGHFVKTSGLRWLSPMLIVPIPWAARSWALPFLTILAPSERWSQTYRCRHKPLTAWARQAILQTRRWLPGRRLILVADSGFAALDLIGAIRRHVCPITRLRLDANLFEPAPPRRPRQKGRPRIKGGRLPKLSAVPADPATVWTSVAVSQWYDAQRRDLLTATGTAVWYTSGQPPAPVRRVLVRDPSGKHDPQAFLSTDLDAEPETILGWFVRRWRVETTFQEARAHLGVETQRQWSDLAILRTTPALPGLFSLITLWADSLVQIAPATLRPNTAAWYHKREPTFSDAIAAVRRVLWCPPDFSMSRWGDATITIPTSLMKRFVQTLCLAA